MTPDQRGQIPGYRAPPPRTGQGVEQVKDLVEDLVRRVYSAADLAAPQKIVWCEGPVSLARDWMLKGTVSAAGPNVRGGFTGLIDGARNTAFNAVTAAVWESVERGTVNPRAATTCLGIRNAVVTAVDRTRLGFSMDLRSWFGRGERRSSFRDSSWSYIDALDYNLAAYRFIGDATGNPSISDPVEALWALSNSVSWIVPHEKVCWIAGLPTVLSTDTAGRLHSGTDAALKYADDWKVYTWKGIVIPEWVVTRPDLMTVRSIDRQVNPWIRRCMIEIMTPEQYFTKGGATCVNRDGTGKLWRRQWWGPGDDAWAAVEVLNGTAERDGTFKRYYLQVPSNVRTAREAVAWTYGLTDSQYANLVLRT